MNIQESVENHMQNNKTKSSKENYVEEDNTVTPSFAFDSNKFDNISRQFESTDKDLRYC